MRSLPLKKMSKYVVCVGGAKSSDSSPKNEDLFFQQAGSQLRKPRGKRNSWIVRKGIFFFFFFLGGWRGRKQRINLSRLTTNFPQERKRIKLYLLVFRSEKHAKVSTNFRTKPRSQTRILQLVVQVWTDSEAYFPHLQNGDTCSGSFVRFY